VRILRRFTHFAFIDELLRPIRSRCHPIVTENARVLDLKALILGNMNHIGKLMDASSDSWRVNYIESCSELETFIDAARNITGALVARMTGPGFSGCTVNLVKKENAQIFRETITKHYKAVIDIQPEVYTM